MSSAMISRTLEGMGENGGLLLAAASSFFFSVETLLAKIADLPPVMVNWYGCLGMVLLSVPVVLCQPSWNLTPQTVRLIACRSAVITICHVTALWAVELLPLGDASVLLNTSPAFTTILARISLKEPCTVFSSGMIAIVMIGVVLLTQPSFLFVTTKMSSTYKMGVSAALLSSLTDAVGNVTLRILEPLHYSVFMFINGLFCLILTTLLIPFTHTMYLISPMYPFLMSVFAALEQITLVWALQLARAGPVSTCQIMDIIFSYVFQIAFFGEKITLACFLGVAVIIGAVIFMSTKERGSEEKIELMEVPVQHVY